MSKDIKKLLGKRIKELRKERNYTQDVLAEKAKIEPASLSNIENGKNYPTAETLAKIASALKVEVYQLYIFDHLKQLSRSEMIEFINQFLIDNESLVGKIYFFIKSLK